MKLVVTTLICCLFFFSGCDTKPTTIEQPLESATGTVFSDNNNNGLKDTWEVGIADVGVSNGRDVVVTDKQGKYKLDVTDDTIVFVIKPTGWMVPLNEDNLPQFYYINKPAGSPDGLRAPGIKPTGNKPASIDFGLQRQWEPDRFKVAVFGDPQPSSLEQAEYYKQTIAEEAADIDAVFGVSLGDIVGDKLNLLDEVNAATALIGLPWYYVAGNHDRNYSAANDAGSLETFKSIYGPADYSFNYGKVHFVVLDSIIAYRDKENKPRYNEGLDEIQIDFLRNDLKLVEKDTLVVMFMHGGFHYFYDDTPALTQILDEYSHTLSIAGHDHTVHHEFYSKGPGKNQHHNYVAGAVCGSWWTGAKDSRGLPHSMMKDGGPKGYAVLSLDRNKYKILYKAFGRPDDYQMSVWAPKEVSVKNLSETEVIANVFNASKKATVKMRIDKKQWLPMKNFAGKDNFFQEMILREKADGIKRVEWAVDATETKHLFKAYLPEYLEPGLHVINVEAVDMFGETFTGTQSVKITK
jgi:C terminal of Calcineurin-like phosphoesterase/N terminal of Calcineurin-like phosphoesterase/Calcineurin-like phosphoesterase